MIGIRDRLGLRDKGDNNKEFHLAVYQDSNPLQTSRHQDSLVRFIGRGSWGIVSTIL
jgi:hypothetical protein